jgi:hypothetical protein
MDADSLQAQIQHESAELHALYPDIKKCHTALVRWTDPEGGHYSLRLDIRWSGHQMLVSGEVKDSAAAAIEAGFKKARQRVHEAAWANV